MPSKIKTEILAVLKDKNGKTIKTLQPRKANSLLKQFIQLLACQFGAGNQTMLDVGAVSRVVGQSTTNFDISTAGTGTVYGMLIGTGTTPVTMTDTKIETQVSTNIAHAAHTLAVENPDASTWRLNISRIFTNNTGALLQIKEVAIHATGATFKFCLDHSLYSLDVPAGVSATLTYRITVSL